MKAGISRAARIRRSGKLSTGKNTSMRIRAKLLAMGLTLKDWARLAGISYPQVCLAVHGHRTDQRSQQIMKMLEEFKGTK